MIEFVYLTYLVGAATPGPSTFAIMHTSLERGRVAGLVFACGILSGSLFWGISSAFGLSAIITKSPLAYLTLTLLGGVYMLWFSYNSARQVIDLKGNDVPPPANDNAPTKTLLSHYIRALMIHLTNPKAISVWLSIILLGTSGNNGNLQSPFAIVIGCGILGCILFFGNALIFSTRPMIALYTRIRKPFTLVTAAIFALAGLVLLYRAWAGFR